MDLDTESRLRESSFFLEVRTDSYDYRNTRHFIKSWIRV